MTKGHVSIINLRKQFAAFTAVDALSLEVPGGQFFTIVGPSGCGKTTTLRMLAGFVKPTSGRIILDDKDVQNVPPYKRNVNTVFQNYALFPHYNVYDNVAYGLRRARCPKNEIKKRVGEVLDIVELTSFASKKPTRLSGGQQQRVALARALVLNPAVLLLDEPLGALDAKLRKTLQVELKSLQQRLGITFVFVTHDQEEALTMSDRIAVMNNGKLEQVGTAKEMYEDPQTEFVAMFLGTSNMMDVDVCDRDREGAGCQVRWGDIYLRAQRGHIDAQGGAKCIVRPERLKIEPEGAAGENRLPGVVERIVYLGSSEQIRIRLNNDQVFRVAVQNSDDTTHCAQGDRVTVHMPAESLRILRSSPE